MNSLTWPTSSPVIRTPINGEWRLSLTSDVDVPAEVRTRFLEGAVPARVPGNVHDALLGVDLIDDPYVGTQELDSKWVGQQDWCYSTALPELPDMDHHTIVFEGLDTTATVHQGDERIGTANNMHREYRFPITPGGDIEVAFTSPYRFTDRMIEAHGEMPGPYEEPFSMIRKMAANYGWDWGPTVVTEGIWRPVVVESWNRARLNSVQVSTSIEGSDGVLRIRGDVLRVGSERTDLRVGVRIGDTDQTVELGCEGLSFAFDLRLPGIDLWWPHTMGEQALYDVEIALWDDVGEPLDLTARRVGFRSVELRTDPDDQGLSFGFVINGHQSFARGWNWIPDDPLVDRVTPERYRERLQGLKDTGADWIRVWGGGIYEDDIFYGTCDELGLLVWQDFAFACAAYPESPEFEEEIEHEAMDNVTRLMSHPSLAIWCGNNENFMGLEDWGWEEELEGRKWGETYYLETLPKVCSTVDPLRPYWPGSPYSGGVDGVAHNDPNYGCFHSWDIWNREDYEQYKASAPRFVSEFGWQSAPSYSTLAKALPGDVLSQESSSLAHHQKAEDGMEKLWRGIGTHFTQPKTFDQWLYLTQVVQARAIATGVGYWRSLWPVCQGVFIWQYNDCWPVLSWAAEDSSGRRKPVWFTARDYFKDRTVVVQSLNDEPPKVDLVNNSEDQWLAEVTVHTVSLDGLDVNTSQFEEVVPAGSVVTRSLNTATLSNSQLLVVDCEDQRRVWRPVEDRELDYPEPRFSVAVEPHESGAIVTISADLLLCELQLSADRISSEFESSSELVTLLPGESHSWNVTGDPALLEAVEWSVPIVMSLGDLPSSSRRE